MKLKELRKLIKEEIEKSSQSEQPDFSRYVIKPIPHHYKFYILDKKEGIVQGIGTKGLCLSKINKLNQLEDTNTFFPDDFDPIEFISTDFPVQVLDRDNYSITNDPNVEGTGFYRIHIEFNRPTNTYKILIHTDKNSINRIQELPFQFDLINTYLTRKKIYVYSSPRLTQEEFKDFFLNINR